MLVRRLKTRAQFQAVLQAGRMLARTPHFALHRLEGLAVGPEQQAGTPTALFPQAAASDAWASAMVPKRWARRAVTRNTVKRQVHALSETFEPRLRGAAHVVRLRAGFDRKQFVSATSDALKAALRIELTQLLERLPQPASQHGVAAP